MLQEIESAAKGEKSSELLPESWRGKLNLVPALANEETKAMYVHNIIATKRGDFLSAKALIQQHPYLLWRVPETAYKQSLASYNPDGRVLLALGAAIEDEKLWPAQGNEVMDAIWTSLQDHGIDKLVVYDTLRLVGAGCHDVVSQSSSRMFMLLGREEWRFRLGRVKSIMNTVSSQVV